MKKIQKYKNPETYIVIAVILIIAIISIYSMLKTVLLFPLPLLIFAIMLIPSCFSGNKNDAEKYSENQKKKYKSISEKMFEAVDDAISSAKAGEYGSENQKVKLNEQKTASIKVVTIEHNGQRASNDPCDYEHRSYDEDHDTHYLSDPCKYKKYSGKKGNPYKDPWDV